MGNQTFTPATVTHFETFTKPAVQSGVIPRNEWVAAIKTLKRQIGKGNNEQKEEKREELLTYEQAAKWCRVSKKTLSRMVRQGLLSPVRLDPNSRKSIRFKKTDIENLIEGGDHDNDVM